MNEDLDYYAPENSDDKLKKFETFTSLCTSVKKNNDEGIFELRQYNKDVSSAANPFNIKEVDKVEEMLSDDLSSLS